MSQRDRILRWLRARGQEGVHSFEFYDRDPWGGPSMPRGAAVINDLVTKHGFEIDSVREEFHGRSGGVRYRLVAEPQGATPDEPANVEGGQPEAVALFGNDGEQNGATNTRSPYDVYEDAA